MNILIVSQYFYPENFRINQLCIDLRNRGHNITIFTGKPNYPEGKVFEGYCEKGFEVEEWENMKIYRCPLRGRKSGSFNLLKNYFSFVHNGKKYIKKLKQVDFDLIYIFEVSPMTVALPAIKLKKITQLPIIINIQDLWPDNIVAVTGIDNKLVVGLITKLVKYIYKRCDLILAASPSFVPKIQELIEDKHKVVYWPQYSTVKKVETKIENLFEINKTNLVFAGNIGEAQGLEIVIEAAKILNKENFCFHIIGNGRSKDKLECMVKEYNLEGIVKFLNFKPEEEIPYYLGAADAALLILKPDPVFEMTIPAKLQTYFACGAPVLGCVSGEGKRIILESNAGLVSDSLTVDGFVKICRAFKMKSKEEISNLRINSLKYGTHNFDKDALLDRLEELMEAICL